LGAPLALTKLVNLAGALAPAGWQNQENAYAFWWQMHGLGMLWGSLGQARPAMVGCIAPNVPSEQGS